VYLEPKKVLVAANVVPSLGGERDGKEKEGRGKERKNRTEGTGQTPQIIFLWSC